MFKKFFVQLLIKPMRFFVSIKSFIFIHTKNH